MIFQQFKLYFNYLQFNAYIFLGVPETEYISIRLERGQFGRACRQKLVSQVLLLTISSTSSKQVMLFFYQY